MHPSSYMYMKMHPSSYTALSPVSILYLSSAGSTGGGVPKSIPKLIGNPIFKYIFLETLTFQIFISVHISSYKSEPKVMALYFYSTPLASKVHCSINGLENSSSPEYSKVQHLLEITVGLFSVGVGLFFVTGGLGKSPPPTKKSPTPTEKSPTLTVKSPTYKKSSSNQKKVLLQRKKVLL